MVIASVIAGPSADLECILRGSLGPSPFCWDDKGGARKKVVVAASSTKRGADRIREVLR